MQKTIKPAVPAEVQYICDICGKEIEQDAYRTSVVEISMTDIGGNGWNEWPEKHIYHSHRKCLSLALDVMKKNKFGGL